MKTLDEVIKALEVCTSDRGGCEECPYDPDCKPDKKWDEAIYYLKEYREQKENIDALPDYYDLVNFWAESQANPELTWEELEQMEGKPIWLVSGNYAGWEIIEYIGKSLLTKKNILETNYEVYHQEDFNKSWQAYRKEQN